MKDKMGNSHLKIKKTYVYKITNRLTGQVYIGMSIRPIQRVDAHAKGSTKLGRDIKRLGRESFSFEVLSCHAWRHLAEWEERRQIIAHDSVTTGYNTITPLPSLREYGYEYWRDVSMECGENPIDVGLTHHGQYAYMIAAGLCEWMEPHQVRIECDCETCMQPDEAPRCTKQRCYCGGCG